MSNKKVCDHCGKPLSVMNFCFNIGADWIRTWGYLEPFNACSVPCADNIVRKVWDDYQEDINKRPKT